MALTLTSKQKSLRLLRLETLKHRAAIAAPPTYPRAIRMPEQRSSTRTNSVAPRSLVEINLTSDWFERASAHTMCVSEEPGPHQMGGSNGIYQYDLFPFDAVTLEGTG